MATSQVQAEESEALDVEAEGQGQPRPSLELSSLELSVMTPLAPSAVSGLAKCARPACCLERSRCRAGVWGAALQQHCWAAGAAAL